MSSTVTTTTVTLMTTAITLEGLMASLTLACLVLLSMLMLTKEIVVVGSDVRTKRLCRGLDIAVLPMALVFVLMLLLSSVNYFNGY